MKNSFKKKHKKHNSSEELSPWRLVYHGYNGPEEKLRETLCTLGNGYMGVRGVDSSSRDDGTHYPGTYIAGLYNTLATRISGRDIYNEDMVNCPNCLPIEFQCGCNEWDHYEYPGKISFKQELDFKRGILSKSGNIRETTGKVFRFREERTVHMERPHILALSYELIPEKYSGVMTFKLYIDGSVENNGVERYRELKSKHLAYMSSGTTPDRTAYLTMKTVSSGIVISEAFKFSVLKNGKTVRADISPFKEDQKIGFYVSLKVSKSENVRLEKVCCINTSMDLTTSTPQKKSLAMVRKTPGWATSKKTHTSAWKDLWKKCDLEISGDPYTQAIIRFHIFHLLQSASPHNAKLDAGLTPRGLHGESYRGHIFWDEIFVFPFLSTHLPETGKALLMYRYRRLGEARKSAEDNGYDGSMFPWQSGSSGKEETQSVHLNPMSGKWGPDLSRNQRHVSFAIAYNVWRHWVITKDREFFEKYGAELLLSIAKFASSLCRYDEKTGKYHTHGLMGPDEFHEKLPGSKKAGLKDNAYSNVFIVWLLLRALDTLELLTERKKAELLKTTGIKDDDIPEWHKICQNLNLDIREDGMIAQFSGYFELKELNWEAYRKKYGNIHRLDRILKAEGRSPDEYKVSKQADLMMLFYLFTFEEVRSLFKMMGYRLTKKMLRDNYKYYERRTSHGSTLSKVVHCYVAHLLGMKKDSMNWYKSVLEADIHDIQGGTTPEGIHTGIMGGSIDIALRAFGGVYINENSIDIECPSLPKGWEKISTRIKVRGQWIRVEITGDRVTVSSQKPGKCDAEVIRIGNTPYTLPAGKKLSISFPGRQKN